MFRTAPSDQNTGSGGTRNTKFCVVNTQDGLAEMVETIVSQDKVTLYVAMEASLLVLHVHPVPDCSYIVDLQSLGPAALESCEGSRAREAIKALEAPEDCEASSTTQAVSAEAEPEETEGECPLGFDGKWQQGSPLPSLKAILESKSPCVPKVLFDCRQTCAFLAGRFGVRIGSVEDIQCLEFEGRFSEQDEQRARGDAVEISVKLRGLRSCLE